MLPNVAGTRWEGRVVLDIRSWSRLDIQGYLDEWSWTQYISGDVMSRETIHHSFCQLIGGIGDSFRRTSQLFTGTHLALCPSCLIQVQTTHILIVSPIAQSQMQVFLKTESKRHPETCRNERDTRTNRWPVIGTCVDDVNLDVKVNQVSYVTHIQVTYMSGWHQTSETFGSTPKVWGSCSLTGTFANTQRCFKRSCVFLDLGFLKLRRVPLQTLF